MSREPLCRIQSADPPVAVATETQVERTGTGLLELARFFEAAVTTLLHDRAPEPRELTVERVYPVTWPSDVLR